MGYYSCQALNIAGSVITKALLEVTDGRQPFQATVSAFNKALDRIRNTERKLEWRDVGISDNLWLVSIILFICNSVVGL